LIPLEFKSENTDPTEAKPAEQIQKRKPEHFIFDEEILGEGAYAVVKKSYRNSYWTNICSKNFK